MSAPSPTRRLFASCILCALTACGLGTEVGNGDKPKDDDPKKTSAAPDSAGAENTEAPANTASDVGGGQDEDKTDGATDAMDGGDEGGTDAQGSAVDQGPPSTALLADALDAITAQCASAWYDTTFKSPTTLGTAEQAGLLTATFDKPSATWTIVSDIGGTHVTRTSKPVEGNPSVTIVKDDQGTTLPEKFTCGDGGGWGDGNGNGGGFMDLHMSGSDAITHVYWDIKAPAPEEYPAPATLTTISVSRVGEGELLLKAP